MITALKQLLDDLDDVAHQHDEVEDTDVREQMSDAIRSMFIVPKPGYVLPDEFGMFSVDGNRLVRAALSRFLASPDLATAAKTLVNAKHRLDAFQNSSVTSKNGRAYDDYFGYTESA